MASRLVLKDIKAPIRFLLRNPASSATSRTTAPLAQTIQNLLVPTPRQSAGVGELSISGFLGELGLSYQPLLSRDFNDGGFRIEVRGKGQPVVEDVDEQSESESESDFEGSDGFDVEDLDELDGGVYSDVDDAEPSDDEI